MKTYVVEDLWRTFWRSKTDAGRIFGDAASQIRAVTVRVGDTFEVPCLDHDVAMIILYGVGHLHEGDESQQVASGGFIASPSGTALTLSPWGEDHVELLLIENLLQKATHAPARSSRTAAEGDTITLHAANDALDRVGRIIGTGTGHEPPFTIRWDDDGHTSLYFPATGAEISAPVAASASGSVT